MKKFFHTLLILVILGGLGFGGYELYNYVMRKFTRYIGSDTGKVTLYDKDYKEATQVVRGTKVTTGLKESTKDDKKYYDVKHDDKDYFILESNLTEDYNSVVYEKTMYVRTSTTVYKGTDGIEILGFVKKGTALTIIGFDKLDSDGNVNLYKINYNDGEGYVYRKYTLASEEDAKAPYDAKSVNLTREDLYGGGSPATLDYYPYEKAKFEDNVMPDEVRAFYVNSAAAAGIDAYITLAKASNINALVIDVKGNGSATYSSPVMQKYSPTSYSKAVMSLDAFKEVVKKCHDNNIYVIGRISAFNDIYYATDHPEYSITGKDGKPYQLNSTYWPSAYQRAVWEYNVALGVEAVGLGVNEIQFDYMRFPDRTYKLETSGTINFRNDYNETKAEALQTFAMYATDAIHNVHGYVSADVFGETSNDYVAAYGQYWPALSNIVDVMSAMPYPDHFSPNSYNLGVVVWTVPYKLLYTWGGYVQERQKETTSPAIVRTWIQAYNSIKAPFVAYDANKVYDEIKALHDAGLTGGYMTWNSGSSLDKYKEISSAFKKEE